MLVHRLLEDSAGRRRRTRSRSSTASARRHLRRARSAGEPVRAICSATRRGARRSRRHRARELDRARGRVPGRDEGRRGRGAAAGRAAQRSARRGGRRLRAGRRRRRCVDARATPRDAGRWPASTSVFVSGRLQAGARHCRRRSRRSDDGAGRGLGDAPRRPPHRHRPGGDHLHLGQHRRAARRDAHAPQLRRQRAVDRQLPRAHRPATA